ncbi:hypothetical protein K466DRAFT_476152 [Polyporus arcularius HHB13444]|uniref:Spindle pole body component n=1 Tax=Polyporus arcularius HHB13444 TaxID=1314778 RepID=A0A5C3PXN5_9APHY|nr:hypothetical protein K466DRAFT_476152 [Polyporus arcularius HHB13444]
MATSLAPTFEDIDDADPTMCSLPELRPQFFIPRLEEKPQNPIMDTLRLWKNRSRLQVDLVAQSHMLPPELQLLSEDVIKFEQAKRDQLESIWTRAVSRRHGSMNQLLSWDALRSSFNANAVPSPFLSEQSSETFASARYHVRPPIYHPDVQIVYVHVPDLCRSLLLTVSGTSSYLHIWDQAQQKFLLKGLKGRKDGQIVIVGKDEVVSASLFKRFLTIGNLMRRLELVTESPQSRRHSVSRSTPIVHAFTHAISSILAYLRQMADRASPELHADPGAGALLTALWTRFEDMEHILLALAALCSREEHVEPPDYNPIPATTTDLLSLVYRHLADHIERSSPRVVTAMLAFILTTTSRSYIQILCTSVGYTTRSAHFRPTMAQGRTRQEDRDRLEVGLMDDEEIVATNGDDDEADGFPEFITAEMAEVFSRARKSLVLLCAADPEHPLLTGKHLHPEIEWLWTEEQLEHMDEALAFSGSTSTIQTTTATDGEGPFSSRPRDPEDVMHAFKVFDLLPGETRTSAHSAVCPNVTSLLSGTQSTSALRAFLTSFPPTLPSSTPTLAHLSARVLSPLIIHAQTLSGALVARFLTPSTHLHLHTHLVLLRGYILITAHSFKSRLQDALFYDAEDVSAAVVGSRTYAASEVENAHRDRQRTRTKSGQSRSHSRAASGGNQDVQVNKKKSKEKKPRRAVGLSPSLIIGDKWPPLGSDLNFLLRTVIVDALEEGRAFSEEEDEERSVVDDIAAAQKRIVEEAGWRLGFAIRDLPVGTGREKWLNPLCESLDFLYMHYQPPPPLDVLITPAILSKYHRMFAFNLRLMRVENVVRTLFRLTRKASAPLFPTLTPSNKLLLHFRFTAHSFVMTLSSYVYDIAIGSNMDAFLGRLAAASSVDSDSRDAGLAASTSSDRPTHERAAFADVFSLAEFHSRVLDDILSSCLLRSGQKAVGDILRGCMELVLELGVFAGEIRDGNLEEYEAAPILEELWGRFRAKMSTFVKVLKALVEKEADASGLVLSDIPLHMMQGHRRVSGTTANLHQLLLRLNMSDWWTRKQLSRPT